MSTTSAVARQTLTRLLMPHLIITPLPRQIGPRDFKRLGIVTKYIAIGLHHGSFSAPTVETTVPSMLHMQQTADEEVSLTFMSGFQNASQKNLSVLRGYEVSPASVICLCFWNPQLET
ncbi:hypothetical protein KC19_6G214000 [Ceratodon purpureus]|uniref:Uncharacterized protein n=1 Tax=Ceratodon purpureus TaxID=3225 RepID=A0A8T0HK13_CERPU|nr:hypothetical protein KC19_6G214000 [Ceratodon purpureus]